MWPILLCSVISVAIIIERTYHFYKAKIKIPNLSVRVKELLYEDKHEQALKLCESVSDPVAHILSAGIHVRSRNGEEREKIIMRTGSKLIRQLDKNLRGLVVIGNIAPLIGLLGTVTGMIKAFMKIQQLGGRVDASVLAGGIWEALITTMAGLSVAIPTMIAYYYFEGKVDDINAQMKDASVDFLCACKAVPQDNLK